MTRVERRGFIVGILSLLAAPLAAEAQMTPKARGYAGWRCLDVRAGSGSVATLLAHRVGPSGTVVAADIDLRFLTNLPPNVEVRRHDITTSDMESKSYDW